MSPSAGLEQFIDTPVKRYSSGMYVRLAFSVAAFLEPEILIIDEVLSVGDAQFQLQCMQRMEEIVEDGRTLLVRLPRSRPCRQICRRAIFLQHGKIIFDGATRNAVAAYEESTRQTTENQHQQTLSENEALSEAPAPAEAPSEAPTRAETPGDEACEPPTEESTRVEVPSEDTSAEPPSEEPTPLKDWPDLSTAPGNDVVKLEAVRVVDANGLPVENLLTTQTAIIEIEFVVLEGGKYLQPGLIFTDALGNTLFWTIDTDPILRRSAMESGRYKSSMVIPADFLAPGTIFIDVGLGQIAGGVESHVYERKVVSFNVIDDFSEDSVRCGYQGPLPGLIRPRMQWITAERQIADKLLIPADPVA